MKARRLMLNGGVQRPRGRPALPPDVAARAQERNQQQGLAVKTVGGRTRYFACTKTPRFQPSSRFFNEGGERKINGVQFYGYCL